MSDRTDEMAIGGATLVGLAFATRGQAPPPGPGPGPGPGPEPGQQAVHDASGTVTASGRTLFGPNAGRTLLAIVNDGDDTVYICFADTPVARTGIRLNSNGGSLIIDAGSAYYGTVSAIAASSDSAVTAVEVYNQ